MTSFNDLVNETIAALEQMRLNANENSIEWPHPYPHHRIPVERYISDYEKKGFIDMQEAAKAYLIGMENKLKEWNGIDFIVFTVTDGKLHDR